MISLCDPSMKKIWIILLLASLSIGSCVKLSEESSTPPPPLFVTSTLPPTKPGLLLPTNVPPTSTPDALTAAATISTTTPCKEGAILVEDVTYPDNTVVPAGKKFTKTWKLQNTGTCAWTGHTIAFVSGDRMNSPDSVPVPETAPKATVDVSIELIAPSKDGAYLGIYELRNSSGKTVPIGTEPTFWVKVIVGAGTIQGSPGTPIVGQVGNTNCTYTTNDGYVQTLISLINQARAEVGRAALTINQQLMNVAQAHSLDMACNNFLLHSGSDGSWIGDRIARAGYPNSYYLEIIAIGLPQDAMNQWRNDPLHWDALTNSRVTEIGVGYVYSKFSAYGGYWTVDMGGR
jgi:uncharacterized protein YkwD